MQKLFFNFQLALEGVAANRLRAFLTALGIVFGVAAVIAMLAIGTGARETILAQMRLIGANNIVVTSLMEAAEGGDAEEAQSAGQDKNTKKWSPGLTLGDVRAITAILPGVTAMSPEIILPTTIIRDGKIGKSRAVGVTNAFFELNNLGLDRGTMFHDIHQQRGDPVCIIGQDILRKYFSAGNPIGQRIKCGSTWLRIIGVLERRIAKSEQLENLGIRDYNQDVYIPLQTALIRFKDRSYAHLTNIGRSRGNQKAENYHQLDRLVVRVDESDELLATSNVIARLLKRSHQGVLDYEMAVPEKMLEAQQKTQDTFNKVLAFIAGISLLVGGIGIMNIMLASVLERTKEIGTRRSLGATQQDIVQQFLLEAIFISLLGGITGIIVGVGAARFIAANYDIPTEVSLWSVLLSFGVASVIGLVFGLFPAQRAAKLDPIKALRSD
jgi:putative ABC transport system permease protein